MSCCKYKTGDFKHRLTIQRLTHAKNASGFDATTVATYMTVWAMIKPLNSREKIETMQLAFKTTHKIIIRYSTTNIAITTGDRLKYGDRYFNITGIMNIDEDDKYIQINAQESLEAST